MDHVLAVQINDHRLAHRQVELVDRGDVVFRGGIAAVEAQRVALDVDLVDRGAAKDAIRAGIVDVPGELLADQTDPDRVLLRRKLRDALRPQRDREPDQQDRLDERHGYLDPGRGMAGHAGVAGHRVLRAAEAPESDDEEEDPADEQNRHQHVHPVEGAVDPGAVRRGVQGKPPFHHVEELRWNWDHSEAIWSVSDCRARLRR